MSDKANDALNKHLSSIVFTGKDWADYKMGFFAGYEAAKEPVSLEAFEDAKQELFWLKENAGKDTAQLGRVIGFEDCLMQWKAALTAANVKWRE